MLPSLNLHWRWPIETGSLAETQICPKTFFGKNFSSKNFFMSSIFPMPWHKRQQYPKNKATFIEFSIFFYWSSGRIRTFYRYKSDFNRKSFRRPPSAIRNLNFYQPDRQEPLLLDLSLFLSPIQSSGSKLKP
jgi:hypothetical protein